MRDLVMSLVSSVLAGTAVWLGQRLLRYRRLARKRAFFGVSPDDGCLLVSPRHFSSPHPASVHRNDMAALVALATVVNDCGARAEVITEAADLQGVGRVTEFCVGGPTANPRTAAHLRAFLPGLRVESPAAGKELSFSVGSARYPESPDRAEYALLVKTYPPASAYPIFVLAGQRAQTNLATARLLAHQYRRLLRSHGATGRFCLVLRIPEPAAYGADFVEIAADVTDEASRATPAPGGAGGG